MITLIVELESLQGFDTGQHGESSILVMRQMFFSEWFFNLSSEFNFVGIGSMVVCPQFHKFQHCLCNHFCWKYFWVVWKIDALLLSIGLVESDKFPSPIFVDALALSNDSGE